MKKLCALLLALGLCLGAQAQAQQAQLLRVTQKEWTQEMLRDAFLDGRQVEIAEEKYGFEYVPAQDAGRNTMRLAAIAGRIQFKSDALHSLDSLIFYFHDLAGVALEQAQEMRQQSGEGFSYAARSRSAGVLEVRRAESDAAADEKTSRNVARIPGIALEGAVADFSLDQALETLRHSCGILGIEAGDTLRYSALDVQGLESLRQQYISSIKERDRWGSSVETTLLQSKAIKDQLDQLPLPEEGYLIRLAVNYAGVPCQCPLVGSDDFDGGAFYPNYLLAYVTKSGLQYLECPDTLYDIQEAKPAGTNTSLSQAQAAAKAGGDLSGHRAAYEYVPVKGKNKAILLQPAWCFYPEDGSYPIRVNAFNGKVMK